MGGRMYLGNQMVTPVIIQGGGEQSPFPVRTLECDLNQSGYIDGVYIYRSMYNGYNEKPFWFDASGIKAMEVSQIDNKISPWFGNAFNGSSIKYIDFSELYHLPTMGRISGYSTPFTAIVGNTEGVHIYFRALTTQTYFNPKIFRALCLGGATNTTVHFPSNLESIISGLEGYPNFGGINTTIAYDLPATS